MKRTPDLIHHAVRQMCKAADRGDLKAALQWTSLAERQLDIIARLASTDAGDRRLWRYRYLISDALKEARAVMKANLSSTLAGGGG